MTFDTRGHTMMGVTPEQAVEALVAWGADAVGGNCGNGPDELLPGHRADARRGPGRGPRRQVERRHARARRHARRLPRRPVDDGRLTASRCARPAPRIVGACCGSTPGPPARHARRADPGRGALTPDGGAAAQGRRPAARGRARGPLARAARHDPGHRGPRLRLGLARRAPALPLAGPTAAWAVGGLVDARGDRRRSPSRIEFGPLVACTAFHNPAVLAKQASTIDEISGGRLILGLGAGWNETEFRAFGVPFDHRVDRFEEAFTIIRTLLQDGAIDFDGRFYQARDCELLPRGPRPTGPPLMIGSNGPRMLRIAAPHVQAWNSWFADIGNTPDGRRPRCVTSSTRPAATSGAIRPTSSGRSRSSSRSRTARAASRAATRRRHRRRWKARPRRWRSVLACLRRAGIGHVQLVIDPITRGVDRGVRAGPAAAGWLADRGTNVGSTPGAPDSSESRGHG